MPPDPPSISMLRMLIVLRTIYTIDINQDPPLAKFWIRPCKVAIFYIAITSQLYEKTTSVWNQTQGLLYYTHVDKPSNNYACGKLQLVGCLTYHKRIIIKFDTYVNNKLLHGMPLLWHFIISYIVYFSIIISVSTIVICLYIM